MLLCTHVITLSEKELAQSADFSLLVHEKLRMVRLGIDLRSFMQRKRAAFFPIKNARVSFKKNLLLEQSPNFIQTKD
jgi:hypothetical protein